MEKKKDYFNLPKAMRKKTQAMTILYLDTGTCPDTLPLTIKQRLLYWATGLTNFRISLTDDFLKSEWENTLKKAKSEAEEEMSQKTELDALSWDDVFKKKYLF